MDALSATASIIAILQLSAKVLSYLNDVKDASKGRALCAIEASNIHNLLTKLRFRLAEGHEHQSWFIEVQALAVENGPLDQFKQALETLQTKMTDGGRLKKVGEALIWKFRKEEVDAILVQMERLKTLTEIALLMDHLSKLSQAIKDDMDSIRMDVSAIQSTIDKFQHTQATASQCAILEWLSSSDYPAQQSDIIKRRQEGTGQWFLDAPKVARWLNEPKSTLFCPGIPGAGKTMLAAIAVEQLLAVAQSNSYGVAYVYCNYKSQADQDTASLLTAILKQLVQGRASALGPVERLHQKHANRGTKPSLDDVYRALGDVLALYSYVYIVVDALDECQEETRRQLLPKLLDLQNRADVRLLATSRFVRDVDNAFQSALRLEVQASSEDVKQFVAGQIHRLPRGVQRDVNLQKLMQKRVSEAVGGMFLLARLHMDSLSDNTTPKEVKSILATLSTGVAGLDDAYSKALERIEGQRANHARLAKNILTWITLAKRSLTTDEICCALAVEPGGNEIDPDNMPDVDDIVSVCAGLVVVDQESAVIRLVHYTTQNYFESIGPRMSPDGQLHIAATCLTYLSFSVFESGSCATNEEFEERLCQHKLLDYAARHCGEHARHVEAEVAEAIYSYVTHNGLLACTAEVLYAGLSYNYNEYSQTYTAFTALHWASRFGLCKIVKGYLRMKAEDTVHAVHARDRDGHSLMHATEHKQDTAAKLLLDKDEVDVNAKDYSGQTPLSLAATHGHDAVVQLLLSIDEVDADTRDSRGRTPLSWAASSGSIAVAKLLLATSRVDVNAPNEHGWTPLLEAAFHGQDAVVKLLLNTDGIDVHTKDCSGRTPLSLAATHGHDAVVQLLLSIDELDADTRDSRGRTPLSWAASSGSIAVAKLLLATGRVDVNAPNEHGWTPLLEAASHGQDTVVKLLLNTDGIDVHAKDYSGRTPLSLAATHGHDAVVQLLLSIDEVDADTRDSRGRTPLSWAASSGSIAVAKLLLATSRVDVNAPNEHGWTPLLEAAFHGRDAVVKLLLNTDGIDVHAKDCSGRTPLSLALEQGHEAVVKLLCNTGKINVVPKTMMDRLHCSSQT